MRAENLKNIFKVVIVAVAAYLVWVGFSDDKRQLSPLEQKVEQELSMEQVPVRYSDGSWSVSGLLVRSDINVGDAFMVRGVVREVSECDCPPDVLCQPCVPPYVQLSDLKGAQDVLSIQIEAREESLFKKGKKVALQIRVFIDSQGQPQFETF